MPPSRGGQASQVGAEGEERAARHLVAHGCKVLARNWRAYPGEIDIVAECPNGMGGTVLLFVEVRTRHGRPGLGEESITPHKSMNMGRAAYAYMQAHGIDPESAEWRIDLVSVAVEGSKVTLNWIKGAVEE